jgi:hypothetical protein
MTGRLGATIQNKVKTRLRKIRKSIELKSIYSQVSQLTEPKIILN